ncbi:isopentenyl-diphosphate Delta-isomerase [Microbacterium soli]|uniref:Isopentenyl-diphosphate Delta-isomerase n=1 Tax=Microbacterium soli TaxID=446075 RepID=A0ABP7NFS5_9MICO
MELITLLSDDGTPTGSARKDTVHTALTPLHLGFSCYLLDSDGRLLLTRRALEKTTWPGVWTNSFCGHPFPGEHPVRAAERRAHEELGVRIRSIRIVLPSYRYRAVDASGVVENEICPVSVALLDGTPAPDPTEVLDWAWAQPGAVAQALQTTGFVFSPWMREQLPLLLELDGLRP